MFIKRGDGKIVSVIDTDDLKKGNKKAIKKLKDMIKESEQEKNIDEDSEKLSKTKE